MLLRYGAGFAGAFAFAGGNDLNQNQNQNHSVSFLEGEKNMSLDAFDFSKGFDGFLPSEPSLWTNASVAFDNLDKHNLDGGRSLMSLDDGASIMTNGNRPGTLDGGRSLQSLDGGASIMTNASLEN